MAASNGQDTGGGKDPDLEEIAGMMVRDLSVHPLTFVGVRAAGRPGAPTLQIDEPQLTLSRHKYFDVTFNLGAYKLQVADALNLINERNDSLALASDIVDLEQQLAEVKRRLHLRTY
ncbi:hypothetical protein IscW_ISCW004560 [Ixodes scapularis]|uniref:Uncharacterized protein n=1 Tax=Ixodes scapularis TaxID=6945 RepID=B7PHD5_IXOSC|nr:hypothetical protein IscW_ISCW004560 [Ixodes scapularis]|eukprot:XP_002402629.1 hypothetical protein IscW_ISCW004560 [Ixodes scapularis]